MSEKEIHTGIVLSGGGSRGAYEAGVILYLRSHLARRLGRHVPLDIVAGTSVGAINAAFLAATNHDPDLQHAQLIEHWRSLELEKLMSLRPKDLLRAFRMLFRKDPPPPQPGSFRYGGLLETSGLERFVFEAIPWRNIRRNLRKHHVRALSISATHVGTGHTAVFISSNEPIPVAWSKDPFVRHYPASIGPRHVLASAAIPLLFPAVKIKGEFYTDGGLRQNTPMSPAIRLGASKILLVSLRHVANRGEELYMSKEREEAFPKPLFLLGKALNALLLDHTEYDLDRMERINAILRAGEDAFGPEFVDTINRKLIELRGAPLRPLRALHIRPSVDIGIIASEFVRSGKAKIRGLMARRFVSRLAEREAAHENDLLSYLLFDGNFAAELINLGYRDAAAKEDELAQFFSDD
ncbi:MAG: patatin-like phospholipase family protein [Proteobacteria bacterium]|nr:patatin-like phospholipase family protein [Pseudomonadota bacterium]